MTTDRDDTNHSHPSFDTGGPPAPVDARKDVLSRGTSVGRYIVLNPLGMGAMGSVHAAYDPELDRKVALKVMSAHLRASDRSDEYQRRLLREAQAMARLSHPNVITVYDTGTFHSQVFVAMELVDGSTLRKWSRQQPRGWREVRDTLVQAGRGLAAAHSAGLIHRDFKPDNVLVGKDGRVHVTDFGIARFASAPPERDLPAVPSNSQPLDIPPTQVGSVVGTPGYMSPEQLAGAELDARSDQFCFCIVLYEALYGERPFEGVHLARLEDQINNGEVRPAPAGSSVPPELRRILLRGLSARPADRFPSMEPLLEALSRVRDPRQARRRWMAGGAAAGALTLLLVGGGYLAAIEGRVCAGADERLSGLWDPPRKETIRQAFLATGKPYAEDAWKTVERVLDTHARAWVDQRTDACVATKVRHEWSEEQMGLRVLCLERQRKQLEALTRVFAEADAAAVENAVTAVSALPDARLCGDVVALASRVKPPESPALRASVDAVRGQLAEAAALLSSGKEPGAFELAKAAAASASGLNHPPVEAEALALRGQLEAAQQADYKTAEKTLEQAVFAAQASGHDEAAVRAFTHLVAVVGDKLGRPEEGLRYARHAEALLTALGGDDRLRAELLQQRGAVLASQGRRQEALEARKEALALAEKVYPADHPTVAIALSNVGWALFEQREYEQALAHQRRALPLLERNFGKAHPRVALVLMRIGNIVNARGDTGEAERSNRRALAILEGAFGPNHARVAAVKQTLGMALYNQGRNDEALALLLSALDVHEKAFGELNLRVSSNLMAVGECLIHQGRFDEARGFLQRARAINARLLGADNVQLAPVLTLLGYAARGQGRREEAIRLFQQSVEVQEKALGADSPSLATDLTRTGELLGELGQWARATVTLERALALRNEQEGSPDELGDTQFALAKVLWQNPSARQRARALATSARENLAKAGAASDEARKHIEAWLAGHAP